ncbi:MAG: glutamate--tRNA ligase [Chloroflexi bacterium]|jgi:glutamyl-tRNA synthetase|nr:glutamate--tRNA ligase [Chloroflexota bacterium]MBT5628191.1 glutamate--tRNA ligase [Chloroflexota bacterium]
MTNPTSPVRVRYAPSPTGIPHIGNIRTALFCWVLAQQTEGQFIVRIEDTDRSRYDADAEKAIFESLEWLGLGLDEGPCKGGDFGPYVQSERQQTYIDAAHRLIESGHAYFDDTTPDQLHALRERQRAAKQPPRYDGRGRHRSPEEIEESRKAGLPITVRLKVPDHGSVSFVDAVRGKITFELKELDDFVILKSDNMPTYHLAHILDDKAMGITHIIRGDEWISSTPRHLLIHQALGIEPPEYVHVPLILGKDKAKLSKRHGATSALEYRDLGFLPDAVFNFMCLLGWSPGDDTEVMPREEIVRRFSIDRINDSPATFDSEKLEWMNGVYIRNMSEDQLITELLPFMERPEAEGGLPDSVERPIDRDYFKQVIPLVHERLKLLTEGTDTLDFFFADNVNPAAEDLPGRKMDAEMTERALVAALELCKTVTSFEPEDLEAEYRALAEKIEMKPGQLFSPIRVATTGKSFAPPLFDTMAAIGQDRCVERIEKAIGILRSAAQSSAE